MTTKIPKQFRHWVRLAGLSHIYCKNTPKQVKASRKEAQEFFATLHQYPDDQEFVSDYVRCASLDDGTAVSLPCSVDIQYYEGANPNLVYFDLIQRPYMKNDHCRNSKRHLYYFYGLNPFRHFRVSDNKMQICDGDFHKLADSVGA